MPARDVLVKRATWKKWYNSHKDIHISRVRTLDQKYLLQVRTFIDSVKEKGCAKCGFQHPAALDFHHVSEDKETSIATVFQKKWSLARVQKEVAKCILLCANCHRIHHYNERMGL